MTVKTNISDDKKVLTIVIEESFEFSQYQIFRDAYSEIDVIGIKFILDLSKAAFMDSSALGMILLLKDHADKLSGELIISKPSVMVNKILEIAQFHKLITIQR
ncbi:STAS domain-containing protein [Brumicola pallidula]|uniref:Anti-sigma factor antagonist, putative n=1 Tax=Brumicola pallidula DSM 14239 = ACAM 615 TaxID=1121922 RepID=K6YWY9_9ALTE|nr:STAS domain-containing protein [Glaciecola pallidula]GAC28491.1 anti-sigma factor antagonist, putative [Glaciecola pallidula DSM 14239 = ACAM 615]